jgi:hypothetical protein
LPPATTGEASPPGGQYPEPVAHTASAIRPNSRTPEFAARTLIQVGSVWAEPQRIFGSGDNPSKANGRGTVHASDR